MTANRFFAFALLAGFFVPSLGSGQTEKIQNEVNEKLDQIRSRERAENIEILRRLLHKGFEASYEVGPAKGQGTNLFDSTTTGAGSYYGQVEARMLGQYLSTNSNQSPYLAPLLSNYQGWNGARETGFPSRRGST